jgi:hypothetical protein
MAKSLLKDPNPEMFCTHKRILQTQCTHKKRQSKFALKLIFQRAEKHLAYSPTNLPKETKEIAYSP